MPWRTSRRSGRAAAVLGCSLLLAATAPMRAQTAALDLGASGDRFTVNGAPAFLLFVSYFDGFRASPAALDRDFAYLKRIGIDGVRAFPNWWRYACEPARVPGGEDTLFTTGRTLREARWPRFAALLDRAAAHGLLVDVSFARETVTGTIEDVSVASYTAQLREVARRLAGSYGHVLFDIQNEFDDRLSVAEVAAIARAVRAEDRPPVRRLVTASTGGAGQLLAGRVAREADLDVAAMHDERADDWYTPGGLANDLAATLQGMGLPRRPVYLQEPMPFARFEPSCNQIEDRQPTHHRQAAANAKAAGAAAWTFHTRTTFALHGESYLTKLERDRSQKTELEALRGAVDATRWGTPAPTPQP